MLNEKDFTGGSVVKNLPANLVDMGSTSGSERSTREGNGNPLPYSYLGNPMDGNWRATDHGIARVRHDLVITKTTTTCIPFRNLF